LTLTTLDLFVVFIISSFSPQQFHFSLHSPQRPFHCRDNLPSSAT
jgi:hypothetical protein